MAEQCFGTDLVIGTVKFRDVLTKEFSHRCVYDKSDTDLLYHEIKIDIETLISEDDSAIGPTVNGNIDQKLAAIRLILHPRRDVEFTIGDRVLLRASADPQSEFRDVNNGPKIKDLKIIYIAGFKSFRISFSLEVARVFCGAAESFGESFQVQENKDVLNNRWTIQETRNTDYYMTRKVTGLLRVAHSSIWPHAMRHLVMPQLVRGYRRESMDFLQSADGLELSYTIIDQQRYAAPPAPAIDWANAIHQEKLTDGGGKAMASISVGLIGAPGTPKSQLLTACAKVVENRLGNLRSIDGSPLKSHVIGACITDFMKENQVELTVDVLHTKLAEENNILFYIGIVFETLGRLPGVQSADPDREDEAHWNADIWPNPIPYDSNTPAGIFATYLQTPCNGYHGMPYVHEGDPENEQPPSYETRSDPEIRVYKGEIKWRSDEVGQNPGTVSPDQKDFPYIVYEVESHYQTDTGILAAPIASSANDASDTVYVGRLHGSIARHVVYVRGKRIGARPQMPEPLEAFTDTMGHITYRLERSHLVPLPPELMPAANEYLYTTEMQLVYVMSRAPKVTDYLRAGSLPWDKTTAFENRYLPKDHISGDII
jgi:hypothetical protein